MDISLIFWGLLQTKCVCTLNDDCWIRSRVSEDMSGHWMQYYHHNCSTAQYCMLWYRRCTIRGQTGNVSVPSARTPGAAADLRTSGEEDDADGDDDEEERVKRRLRLADCLPGWWIWWMPVRPEGDADMEEQQRRNRGLASLTSTSRVSKETKLRLRVFFLDDSERTFEVEVNRGQHIEIRRDCFCFLK